MNFNLSRGQTQSQYLNFGNPEHEGKAEAEATEQGSRSYVVGTHGMGQAQSQFSSNDCSECGPHPYEPPPDPFKISLGSYNSAKQPPASISFPPTSPSSSSNAVKHPNSDLTQITPGQIPYPRSDATIGQSKLPEQRQPNLPIGQPQLDYQKYTREGQLLNYGQPGQGSSPENYSKNAVPSSTENEIRTTKHTPGVTDTQLGQHSNGGHGQISNTGYIKPQQSQQDYNRYGLHKSHPKDITNQYYEEIATPGFAEVDENKSLQPLEAETKPSESPSYFSLTKPGKSGMPDYRTYGGIITGQQPYTEHAQFSNPKAGQIDWRDFNSPDRSDFSNNMQAKHPVTDPEQSTVPEYISSLQPNLYEHNEPAQLTRTKYRKTSDNIGSDKSGYLQKPTERKTGGSSETHPLYISPTSHLSMTGRDGLQKPFNRNAPTASGNVHFIPADDGSGSNKQVLYQDGPGGLTVLVGTGGPIQTVNQYLPGSCCDGKEATSNQGIPEPGSINSEISAGTDGGTTGPKGSLDFSGYGIHYPTTTDTMSGVERPGFRPLGGIDGTGVRTSGSSDVQQPGYGIRYPTTTGSMPGVERPGFRPSGGIDGTRVGTIDVQQPTYGIHYPSTTGSMPSVARPDSTYSGGVIGVGSATFEPPELQRPGYHYPEITRTKPGVKRPGSMVSRGPGVFGGGLTGSSKFQHPGYDTYSPSPTGTIPSVGRPDSRPLGGVIGDGSGTSGLPALQQPGYGIHYPANAGTIPAGVRPDSRPSGGVIGDGSGTSGPPALQQPGYDIHYPATTDTMPAVAQQDSRPSGGVIGIGSGTIGQYDLQKPGYDSYYPSRTITMPSGGRRDSRPSDRGIGDGSGTIGDGSGTIGPLVAQQPRYDTYYPSRTGTMPSVGRPDSRPLGGVIGVGSGIIGSSDLQQPGYGTHYPATSGTIPSGARPDSRPAGGVIGVGSGTSGPPPLQQPGYGIHYPATAGTIPSGARPDSRPAGGLIGVGSGTIGPSDLQQPGYGIHYPATTGTIPSGARPDSRPSGGVIGIGSGIIGPSDLQKPQYGIHYPTTTGTIPSVARTDSRPSGGVIGVDSGTIEPSVVQQPGYGIHYPTTTGTMPSVARPDSRPSSGVIGVGSGTSSPSVVQQPGYGIHYPTTTGTMSGSERPGFKPSEGIGGAGGGSIGSSDQQLGYGTQYPSTTGSIPGIIAPGPGNVGTEILRPSDFQSPGYGTQSPTASETMPGFVGPHSIPVGIHSQYGIHYPSTTGISPGVISGAIPTVGIGSTAVEIPKPSNLESTGQVSTLSPTFGRAGGLVSAGGVVGGDDSFSQADSSVKDGQAMASAQGKKNGGTAQTQVSGTYSGSGSFSASAMTSDSDRSANAQVSGNSGGAISSSQGQGGIGKSQSQVQVNSKSGGTTASSQSGGYAHESQSEVQANEKGGLADAQSSGPGQTSSQAQIGFRPQGDNAEENSPIFNGGGQASAQSGAVSGQSQSQINGNFKYGISYHGAAQAASGTKEQVTTYREQNRRLFQTISQFGSSPKTITERADALFGANTLSQTDNKTPDVYSETNYRLKSSKSQSTQSIKVDDDIEYEEEEDPDYDDGEEFYPDGLYKADGNINKTAERPIQLRSDNSKSNSSMQIGKFSVPFSQNNYNIHQNRSLLLSPKTSSEKIPDGFRGSIMNEPKLITKNLSTKSNKNNEISDRKPNTPDSYVTVTKSITGSLGVSKNIPTESKNFSSTYYTKSSTCGYFTFSCNIVYGANGRSKICKPKAPENGKC